MIRTALNRFYNNNRVVEKTAKNFYLYGQGILTGSKNETFAKCHNLKRSLEGIFNRKIRLN